MDVFNQLRQQLELAHVPSTHGVDHHGTDVLVYAPAPDLAGFEISDDGPRLVTLTLCENVIGECWYGPRQSVRPLADMLVSMAVNGARTSRNGNFLWFDSLLDHRIVRFPPPWWGVRREATDVDWFGGSVEREQVAEWIASWQEPCTE